MLLIIPQCFILVTISEYDDYKCLKEYVHIMYILKQHSHLLPEVQICICMNLINLECVKNSFTDD